MTHEATLEPVRDARGYDIGWAAECDCGWVSDLCEGPTKGLLAWQQHIKTTRGN